jgi:hypothetical protein
MRALFLEHLPQKVIALVIALTLVSLKREEESAKATATVRVRVTTPSDRVLTSAPIDRVVLTLEGKKGTLREIDQDALPDLELNLTGLEGRQLSFEPEMFAGLPSGVRVTGIRPPAMPVQVEERVIASRPVKVVTDGELPRGYEYDGTPTVDPTEVSVQGARSQVDELTQVETKAVPLRDVTQTASVLTELQQPRQRFVGILGRQSVRVTIHVKVKMEDRDLRDRAVEVRGVPDGEPGFDLNETVDLRVRGPLRQLDDLQEAELVPYVDASELGERKRPSAMVRVDVPEGLEVLRVRPEKVSLQRREPSPAPDAPDAGPE